MITKSKIERLDGISMSEEQSLRAFVKSVIAEMEPFESLFFVPSPGQDIQVIRNYISSHGHNMGVKFVTKMLTGGLQVTRVKYK